MRAKTILDQFTYGDLSQVAIGGLPDGEIDCVYYEQYASLIYAAMLDLYKRFPIKVGTLKLETKENVTMYKLADTNAISNYATKTVGYSFDSTTSFSFDSTTAPSFDNTQSTTVASSTDTDYTRRYIIDSATDKFVANQLLHIERVTDAECCELPLNDEYCDCSLFTPEYDTIQIPYSSAGKTVYVTYRKGPQKITADDLENDVEIDLPQWALLPLVYHVSARVFRSTGLDDINKAGQYSLLYEQACQNIENYGLYTAPSSSLKKLENNGWL